MPLSPAVLRVVTSYGDQSAEVRRRVTEYVQRVWGSLDSYNRPDIDRFVRAVVPIVTGGQIQVANLTDAYLAAVESTLTGATVAPLGVPASLVSDEAMRGVPAAEVYARTGPTVWGALKDGVSLQDAVNRGLGRALDMASTDLQLAKTHASRHVLGGRSNVVGYRRVLTGSHTCGLCVVASTQRYHKEDLLPIHPGCSCGVLPIIGNRDPGQVLNPDALANVHAAIADRFGVSSASGRGPVDYRHVLVTHEHGEIGPVLGVLGQNFTGPNDLP